MSLINENDMIIPDTLGLITATVRETNNLNSDSQLAELIRSSDKVYNIVNGRANGIKLKELVNSERISNDIERITEDFKEEKDNTVYESWFKTTKRE